jgi:hypothetical protein
VRHGLRFCRARRQVARPARPPQCSKRPTSGVGRGGHSRPIQLSAPSPRPYGERDRVQGAATVEQRRVADVGNLLRVRAAIVVNDPLQPCGLGGNAAGQLATTEYPDPEAQVLLEQFVAPTDRPRSLAR